LGRFLVLLLLCGSAFAQSPLERALVLAREKRYAEARQSLAGVPEPDQIGARIAWHRLKAAIASGLDDAPDAAGEMEQALRLAPSDPDLLMGTALTEFQAGRLDDAVSHARQSIALAPDKEQFRVALAYQFVAHQDFPSAIQLLQDSLGRLPHSAQLLTLLGIAQYAVGDVDESMASLVNAIAADPKLDAAYRCLAQIALQSSSPPPLSAVTDLCSWDGTVCSALRVRIAREQDNPEMLQQAIAALQEAARENPVARCELARALEWTNHLSEARPYMEACLHSDPSPQNHYRLGLIYQRLGLTDLAQREMDLRTQILQRMSEQTAAGLNALQSFGTTH
jgi:tetratricopeptide (TPR) repeat protein